MKKSIYFASLFCTAAILSLTGCSETTEKSIEPLQPIEPVEQLVPVAFTAGFEPDAQSAPRTEGEPQTRTTFYYDGSGFVVKWNGSEDHPDNHDHIGIVIVKSGTTAPYGENLRHLDYYPSVSNHISPLLAQNGETLMLPPDTYDIYAYYPYYAFQTSFLKSKLSLWINSGQYFDQKQAAPDDVTHLQTFNWMVGLIRNHQITATGGKEELQFDFSHLYSSLEFTVINARDEELTIEKITLNGYDNHRWITPIEYVLDSGFMRTNKDALTLTIENPAVLPKTQSQKFWVCVLSDQEFLEKCIIEVQTDKGTYRTEKALPTNRFHAVANYTTKLTIPQTPAAGDTWTPAVR